MTVGPEYVWQLHALDSAADMTWSLVGPLLLAAAFCRRKVSNASASWRALVSRLRPGRKAVTVTVVYGVVRTVEIDVITRVVVILVTVLPLSQYRMLHIVGGILSHLTGV